MKIDEKWTPVFEDEALLMKALPLQPEEAQKVLAEAGYDFTMDEILEMGKQLYAMKEKMSSGELSEDELEDVAGGINFGGIWKKVREALSYARTSTW